MCDEPAHACSRSRNHPAEQVVSRVEKMIDDWFARD
ncbi:citrate lyase holo-[acyl-carrier protein] synthase [Enterobacter hormaechei subsp. steigerwaltii]